MGRAAVCASVPTRDDPATLVGCAVALDDGASESYALARSLRPFGARPNRPEGKSQRAVVG
jgi:hypothetical protein